MRRGAAAIGALSVAADAICSELAYRRPPPADARLYLDDDEVLNAEEAVVGEKWLSL